MILVLAILKTHLVVSGGSCNIFVSFILLYKKIFPETFCYNRTWTVNLDMEGMVIFCAQ